MSLEERMETVKPKRQRRSFESKLQELDQRIAASLVYSADLRARRSAMIEAHRAKGQQMVDEAVDGDGQ